MSLAKQNPDGDWDEGINGESSMAILHKDAPEVSTSTCGFKVMSVLSERAPWSFSEFRSLCPPGSPVSASVHPSDTRVSNEIISACHKPAKSQKSRFLLISQVWSIACYINSFLYDIL